MPNVLPEEAIVRAKEFPNHRLKSTFFHVVFKNKENETEKRLSNTYVTILLSLHFVEPLADWCIR